MQGGEEADQTGRANLPADRTYESIIYTGASHAEPERISPIKLLCRWIVTSSLFGWIVASLVALTAVCAVLDTPRLEEGSRLSRELQRHDWIIVLAFAVEAVLKIGALGGSLFRRANG